MPSLPERLRCPRHPGPASRFLRGPGGQAPDLRPGLSPAGAAPPQAPERGRRLVRRPNLSAPGTRRENEGRYSLQSQSPDRGEDRPFRLRRDPEKMPRGPDRRRSRRPHRRLQRTPLLLRQRPLFLFGQGRPTAPADPESRRGEEPDLLPGRTVGGLHPPERSLRR